MTDVRRAAIALQQHLQEYSNIWSVGINDQTSPETLIAYLEEGAPTPLYTWMGFPVEMQRCSGLIPASDSCEPELTPEQLLEARDTKIAMLQGTIRTLMETAAENSRVHVELYNQNVALQSRIQREPIQIDEIGSYRMEIERLRRDVERLEEVADERLSYIKELEARLS